MKMSKPMSLLLFTVLALAISGCGKSNNNSNNVPPGGVVPGPYGQQNIPGVGGGNFGSSCTSLQGPIPFQGVMYIDSANVLAGIGAPAPTGGYGGGQYGGTLQMASQNSPYGMLVIQAQMISLNGANGAGTLQLSQAAIQQAAMQSGLPYGQVPCGQVVAINVGHYNTVLYGGSVQIMINGTIPYTLYF